MKKHLVKLLALSSSADTPMAHPKSLRLPDSILSEAQEASKKIEESVPDTLRIALRLGFAVMRKLNYDLVGPVVDAAIQKQKNPDP